MIVLPWNLLPVVQEPGLALDFEQDLDSGLLTPIVTNVWGDVLQPAAVTLRCPLGLQATGASLWIHGRFMQQDALLRHFGTEVPAGYSGDFFATEGDSLLYTSREVAVLTSPAQSQPALVIGCVQPGKFHFDITVSADRDERTLKTLSLRFDLENVVSLAPGDHIRLPALMVDAAATTRELIERYGDTVGALNGARVPATPPSGWCSWYYYYNRVTEADIRENLNELAATQNIDFLQVDDGFQSHTGDWLEPNAKFPSGMAKLASEIREMGLRPGLWLAPFVFHEDSVTLRDHAEMMIHSAAGDLQFVDTWLGRCAVLDCTHPEAEAWLTKVVRTVVNDWGYDYLKLDALAYAAMPANDVSYAKPGTTSLMNLRRGLEIIRSAAGESTFLLGCTCHFGPAIGLVDAMRVGPDVKETWEDGPKPSVRHAMRMTLQRNWMHGRWWANDPDCLLVREDNSALTLPETRFLVTSIALSGGMVVASDRISTLSDERRLLLALALPPPGAAARPVDTSDGSVPSLWRTDLPEKRAVVGILNWSDQARWVSSAEFLAPGETAFDVFNGTTAGMGDILLRAHEGLLYQVAGPRRGAHVVGDSGHVTMDGLYQREVSGRVQVRNDRPYNRTVAILARQRVTVVELQPGESRWFD